jgi:hypothetical protein
VTNSASATTASADVHHEEEEEDESEGEGAIFVAREALGLFLLRSGCPPTGKSEEKSGTPKQQAGPIRSQF